MGSRSEAPLRTQAKAQESRKTGQNQTRQRIEEKRCDKNNKGNKYNKSDINNKSNISNKCNRSRKTAAAVMGILASGICAVAAAPPVQNLAAQMADDSQRPRVALTFDDGPHPVYTKRLLDGLQSRGIRATFFVVGENISGSEDLIRRMADEGHVIGNHTYSHIKLSGITDAEACGEVQKTDAFVRALTGSGTEFIRPPFGSWKKTLECELEMIPVLWDVDPLDWTTKNTGVIVQRVLGDVEPGDIILLHDFYGSSVDAALEIADQLLARGYELVTVDELILI